MRGDIYHSALALQCFRDGSGEDDLTGAMIVADMADDMRQIRQLLEVTLGVKSNERKT